MTLLLSRNDVLQLLTMPDVIETVTQAHIAMAKGEVVMPVRLTLRYDDRPSELEAMPAAITSLPALGMKVITFVGTNSERGIPAIHALVALLDADTGHPLAIMDGGSITAFRTGAASAMATRVLAKTDTRTLAIAGAGVQGSSHLEAMLAVRPFEHVFVVDRDASRLATFVAEHQARFPNVSIQAAGSVREAVADADVIVLVTTSAEPILEWGWIKPGAHINGVGSHSPDTHEMTSEVITNVKLIVDSRDANLKECGDILMAIEEGVFSAEQVETEIGQVLAGQKPGRTSDDEVTLYKSGGLALQDVATAHLVYSRACQQGIGTTFEF